MRRMDSLRPRAFLFGKVKQILEPFVISARHPVSERHPATSQQMLWWQVHISHTGSDGKHCSERSTHTQRRRKKL